MTGWFRSTHEILYLNHVDPLETKLTTLPSSIHLRTNTMKMPLGLLYELRNLKLWIEFCIIPYISHSLFLDKFYVLHYVEWNIVLFINHWLFIVLHSLNGFISCKDGFFSTFCVLISKMRIMCSSVVSHRMKTTNIRSKYEAW